MTPQELSALQNAPTHGRADNSITPRELSARRYAHTY